MSNIFSATWFNNSQRQSDLIIHCSVIWSQSVVLWSRPKANKKNQFWKGNVYILLSLCILYSMLKKYCWVYKCLQSMYTYILNTMGPMSNSWTKVERMLNEHWTNVEWILNESWTNLKWALNKCWPNVERMVNKHWTNDEETLNERWTNHERTLNKCWKNAEWTLNEQWTNSEWTLN